MTYFYSLLMFLMLISRLYLKMFNYNKQRLLVVTVGLHDLWPVVYSTNLQYMVQTNLARDRSSRNKSVDCCTLDIDECSVIHGNCSELANCTNIPGSYNCTCRTGYTGDGFTCTGVFSSYHLSKLTDTNVLLRTYRADFQCVFMSQHAYRYNSN